MRFVSALKSLLNRNLRWPFIAISILVVSFAFMTAYSLESQRTRTTLEGNLSFWSQELTDAFLNKRWLTLAKVGQTFSNPGVKLVRFRVAQDIYFSYPTEADDLSCSTAYTLPVQNYGVTLASIDVCLNRTALMLEAASSPLFILTSVVITLVITFSSLFPIALYRRRLQTLVELLEGQAKGKTCTRTLRLDLPEFSGDPLAAKLHMMVDELVSQRLKAERSAAAASIAAQVAHDIRSPLAALDLVIGDLPELDEERRQLVQCAATRIKEIANDLLAKNRVIEHDEFLRPPSNEPSSVELLASLIDEITTEKRIQHRDHKDLRIEFARTLQSYDTFAAIQPTEFKRLMSNLLNNSIESITGSGTIEIRINSRDGLIHLDIYDNGKGIPENVLPTLMVKGRSYEKLNGSGLGLHHARQMLDFWGGEMQIQSKVGKGTVIRIKLPEANRPPWFSTSIQIGIKSKVVVLDDDESIHRAWQKRFGASWSARETAERLLCFRFTHSLERWIEADPLEARNATYLLDHDLIGESCTGLELIEKLCLKTEMILVTARSEDRRLQEKCVELGVKLVPKAMINLVDLNLIRRPVDMTSGSFGPIINHMINPPESQKWSEAQETPRLLS